MVGDYDFCFEGELVYMQEPYARDRRDPDGGCGCGRGFAGTHSHHATTTARLTRSPLTEADVREALAASLSAGGWLDPEVCSTVEADQFIDEILADIARVTTHFEEGLVVRRHLWKFYVDAA